MNVLIVGSGGREHAMAWQIAKSPTVQQVFVAPGNAGTALEQKVKNVPIDVLEIEKIIRFADENAIDLTIIGPEAPLAAGIVDQFQENNLPCFGPTRQAAQLESSKAFSKDFMQRHGIPTAQYRTFTNVDEAKAYLSTQTYPQVIKADGLAAGKGVMIVTSEEEAMDACTAMLQTNRFGDAGNRIVIEEFLQGEEASFIVMVDGKNVLPLATSQDHKARDNEDRGPNTGGMGAYSPAPVVTDSVYQHILQDIVHPTVNGMIDDGVPYTGFLYVGTMIDSQGRAKVLEYNCRMGDPETQPIMMRLRTSLSDLCQAALNQQFDQTDVQWDPRPALGVVLCSSGYPESYRKGCPISGVEDLTVVDQKIFHAGTMVKDNQIVTNGGRVLCATCLGETVKAAQESAYQLAKEVHWDNVFYRTDIGYRAIARERQ